MPRTVGAAFVVTVLTVAATPAPGAGQEESTDAVGLRPYLGLTAGWLVEGYEGVRADGGLWTVMAGIDLTPTWGLRGQFGPGFELCADRDFCHDHERAGRLSVVRRFAEDFYLLLGVLHLGVGGELALTENLVVLAEVDAAFLVTSAHLWPLVAVAWRF